MFIWLWSGHIKFMTILYFRETVLDGKSIERDFSLAPTLQNIELKTSDQVNSVLIYLTLSYKQQKLQIKFWNYTVFW